MDYLSHALLVPTWEDDPGLNFTATTTGAAETVTITRMTVNQPTLISWGDGTSEILPASSEAALNHVYAVAGTYRVRVHRAQNITGIQIESAQLGGLNTAELRRSPITYFYLARATGCTVRSADMAAWRPKYFLLYSMPTGTYNIDSSDMAEWRPTHWYLYSMPAGEYNIDSADMAEWKPNYWSLNSMPAGTYAIDSSDMAEWRPTHWRLYSMPTGTYTITGTEFAAWTTIINLRCYSLDPAVPTATVDAWINAIWAARHSYSYASNIRLEIGGTNGPPTGTVQNVCPPTTPAEKLYNLRYAQCAGDTHNIWSPITYTDFRGAYDAIPNIVHAYEPARRVLTSYTGPLVRLRRDSDNAESDFYAMANGNLNTAAIAAWLGAATGYVVTVYDQKGGDPITQATAGAQPLYGASVQNGHAGMLFDGSDDYLRGAFTAALSQPSTIFAVAQLDATQVNINIPLCMFDGDDAANRMMAGVVATPRPDTWRMFAGAELISAVPSSASPLLWSLRFSGASSSFWLNGNLAQSGDAGANSLDGITIAASQSLIVGFWKGHINSFIICGDGLADAQRQQMEAAMNAYWGIW